MFQKEKDCIHNIMTDKSIPVLMIKIGTPSVIAMLVTSLYSLVDALFVSRLGADAGAAVGVSFAIQATIQAIAYTLGVGAGAILSRLLGQKRLEQASSLARAAFFFSFFAGLLITTVGLICGDGFIRFLGGTSEILEEAIKYSRNLLFAAPFMCGALVCSQLLRAEGKAVYAMVGLLVGSLINILLDPLFIFVADLGVAGASLATLISQIVSLAVLLTAYIFRFSQIKLLNGFCANDMRMIGKIFVSGTPSLCRQGLSAIAAILTNHAFSSWGASAIEAASIVNRIFLLLFSVCVGIGQGMMPIVGYNIGNRNYDRVRLAYYYGLGSATFLMLLSAVPILFFPDQVISVFRNDREIVEAGVFMLRLVAMALPLHGTITCTTMLLQAMGKQLQSTILACARQGFFFFPFLILLPKLMGYRGIASVQAVSDLSTFLLTIPFVFFSMKLIKKERPNKRSFKGL